VAPLCLLHRHAKLLHRSDIVVVIYDEILLRRPDSLYPITRHQYPPLVPE
jgi:hypothetical protein